MENSNLKQLVKKSNYLIEASYKLSLQEQRIILVVSSLININDNDFKTYKIEAKSLISSLNLSGKSQYSELKTITKKTIRQAETKSY